MKFEESNKKKLSDFKILKGGTQVKLNITKYVLATGNQQKNVKEIHEI